MADLQWDGNSKEMFDKLIESSPKPFRAMTEKKLSEAIANKAGDGGTVTEILLSSALRKLRRSLLSVWRSSILSL